MRNLNLYILACFVYFFLVGCTHAAAQTLSAQEFARQIDTASNAVILDVRTASEFNEGHIKDAVNIDFRNSDFKNRTDSLSKNKPVYIYCLSGGRSAKAASQLRSQGFDVYELNGGMLKWRADNLPEEKPFLNKSSGMTLNDYAHIIKSDQKVLIDFYAEWCAPCKLMEPYILDLQQSGKNGLKVVRIDVDKNPQLARELKIDALPVLHFYKAGDIKWGYVGYLSKKALMKKMRD